jgi:hypothetical protein
MKPNRVTKLWVVVAGSILLLAEASCGGGPQATQSQSRTEPPASVQPLLKQVEAGQEKKRELEAEYKALQLPELVRRLEADSARDVEPFNSLAYREAITRGATVGKELSTSLKAPNRTSFFTLMAVRKLNREAYGSVDAKLKAAILVDALRASKHFNTWGLPHLYWEDSAKAIVELGQTAAEPLKSLLQDKRPAPVWGSEEVMEYQKYQYRVSDYAWALLMQIEGKKVEIPTDPAQRDRLIALPR